MLTGKKKKGSNTEMHKENFQDSSLFSNPTIQTKSMLIDSVCPSRL